MVPTADGPATPDVAQGPEEDAGADNIDPPEMPALQPQPVAWDPNEVQTAPGEADRSSVLRPPRTTRRSRSFKVCVPCGQLNICVLSR